MKRTYPQALRAYAKEEDITIYSKAAIKHITFNNTIKDLKEYLNMDIYNHIEETLTKVEDLVLTALLDQVRKEEEYKRAANSPFLTFGY